MPIVQNPISSMSNLVKIDRNNGGIGEERRLLGYVCLGWDGGEMGGL